MPVNLEWSEKEGESWYSFWTGLPNKITARDTRGTRARDFQTL